MENSSSFKIAELADDIWFEIFLHFSLTAIYKFRSVSKVWCSILSNPNFIKKWYKLNVSSLPWGFVRYLENLQFSLFMPELHSRFISDHQIGFSFSFLFDRLGVGHRTLYLLGTSNGLVLCSTSLLFPETYYVCNPLTQKWVLLPPPPPSGNDWVYTGFVGNESFSESTSYKVIRIPQFKDAAKEFQVVIFSCDLGEWNIYHVSCPSDVTWHIFNANIVIHNGVFYWFQKISCNILAVSVDGNTTHGSTCGNECRLIKLPGQAMADWNKYTHQCLGGSEGLLCFAKFDEKEKSLSVWVLDGDWYILHKDIKLHEWLAEIESRLVFELYWGKWIRNIRVEGLSPVDKNVVILSYKEYVWSYNTKTRVYEQLCHSCFQGNPLAPQLRTIKFVLNPRPTILPPAVSS